MVETILSAIPFLAVCCFIISGLDYESPQPSGGSK
jgi:hypothetical protein